MLVVLVRCCLLRLFVVACCLFGDRAESIFALGVASKTESPTRYHPACGWCFAKPNSSRIRDSRRNTMTMPLQSHPFTFRHVKGKKPRSGNPTQSSPPVSPPRCFEHHHHRDSIYVEMYFKLTPCSGKYCRKVVEGFTRESWNHIHSRLLP